MKGILVIEDNAAIREEVADILTFEGFDVRQAPNGRVGVDMVREAMPDLVICDLMMPEMDGYETLRALREDPASATLPFLCLTARAERQALRQAMDSGADDYITKPFTAMDVLAAVRAAFDKQTSARQASAAKMEQLHVRLTAGLPNELREPLQAIIDGAEAVEEAASTGSTQAVPDLVPNILAAGRQLHRIAENFLLFAQLEMAEAGGSGGVLTHDARVRADVIVEPIVKQLAHEYGRDADLVLDLRPVLACVSKAYLAKLLEELTRNALAFSPAGTRVRVSTAQSDGRVRLCISDQGAGLPPDQLAAALEIRRMRQLIEDGQGFGLGLSIAHRIAALYGGRLEISSTPGRGTVVSVELPAQLASQDERAPAARPRAAVPAESWGSAG